MLQFNEPIHTHRQTNSGTDVHTSRKEEKIYYRMSAREILRKVVFLMQEDIRGFWTGISLISLLTCIRNLKTVFARQEGMLAV